MLQKTFEARVKNTGTH